MDRRFDHIAESRHMGEQVKLLEDNSDMLACFVQFALGRAPELSHCVAHIADEFFFNEDFAAFVRFEEINAIQQRALARTARTDDADDFAAFDVQIDALKHLVAAESFAQSLDLYSRCHNYSLGSPNHLISSSRIFPELLRWSNA